MVDYKLQRFLDAQQGVYNQALAEVKNGKNILIGFGTYFLS